MNYYVKETGVRLLRVLSTEDQLTLMFLTYPGLYKSVFNFKGRTQKDKMMPSSCIGGLDRSDMKYLKFIYK